MNTKTNSESDLNQGRLHLNVGVPPLLFQYAAIMFMVGFADSMMSYSIPVFLESTLQSALLMGLVLSTSSMAGIVADLLFSSWFHDRKYHFFLRSVVFISLLFPILILFGPPLIPVFILAMFIWGIYYELIQFSNFNFIHNFVGTAQHAAAWGILSVFRGAAYTFGPLLASALLDRGEKVPFAVSLTLFAIVGVVIFFFTRLHHSHKNHNVQLEHKPKHSMLHEIKVWKTIFHRVWPLLMFMFTLGIIDATFWTVGTVLSEELANKQEHGMILVAYGIPALFIGIFAAKAAKPFGKKRAAFLAGIIAGLILMTIGFVQDSTLLIGIVFLSSLFLGIAWPQLLAVFEDYVERLGKNGNDFIGLQSSSMGLAYVVGPTFAGIISTLVGNQMTFTVVGLLLVAVSIISLVVVPRKIKMPQAEINNLA